ncbi:hypothetical protein MPSEU_000925500 [Mayamaea pseudoterrestris]|nr:hypothetical protein MPSEU_000925500 [Mayamaea pseudoterrestris]
MTPRITRTTEQLNLLHHHPPFCVPFSSAMASDLLVTCLDETIKKTESSLLEIIEQHVDSKFNKSGLDFLDTKNTLLLSYLIDLTLYLRGRLTGENEKNLDRLNEMKVVLDKIRGLDKKLKYQIDKLLAAASTSFASAEDPLQFRPNVAALDDDASSDSDVDKEVGADGSDVGQDEEGGADEDDDAVDDDADLAAARLTLSLAKEKHVDSVSKEDNIYKAPRHAAVPYTHDKVDKEKEREKRQRRRMRASEVAQTLRAQFDEAPEQDDLHGGSKLGLQREAAQRVARRAVEKEKHEEENFMRLVTKRSDRKERERVMRQENSNLTAISDLGNIVRGAAFVNDDVGNDRDDTDLWTSERHANGKRKKYEMDSDGRAVQDKKKSKFQSKNALQAELFTKKPSGGKKGKQHRGR